MESHKPISNNMNITIKIIYNDTQLNYVYLYIMNYKLYIIIHSKSLIRFHGHSWGKPDPHVFLFGSKKYIST